MPIGTKIMTREMKFSKSITLAPYVSKDAFHKNTYGTAVTVDANIFPIIKIYTDKSGSEVVSSAKLMLPKNTVIGYDDKITLPDNSTPYIGSIASESNQRTGECHYIEVYLSRLKPGET